MTADPIDIIQESIEDCEYSHPRIIAAGIYGALLDAGFKIKLSSPGAASSRAPAKPVPAVTPAGAGDQETTE